MAKEDNLTDMSNLIQWPSAKLPPNQGIQINPVAMDQGSLAYGTNTPRPVDITPQVVGSPQLPQPDIPFGSMKSGETLDKARERIASEREVQRQQQAIQGFMGSAQPMSVTADQSPTQPPVPQLDGTGAARPMTETEQAIQEDVMRRVARGDTAQNRDMQRRQIQQDINVKEAKSGIGARAVIKSLEQQGMSREEIKKAIGADKNPNMSKTQALAELNRLQRSRSKARSMEGLDNKIRDRVVEGARFDKDEAGNEVPKNTEARAKQFMDRADAMGPDPSADSSVYDAMTTSQKRQYDRTISSMSSGTKNPNAERRLNDLIEKTELKMANDYGKKKQAEAKESLKLAQRRAKTAEQNAQISAIKASLSEIDKRLSQKGRSQKPKGEELAQLNKQRDGFIGQLNAFAQGAKEGAQVGAQAQAQEEGNFVVGNTYTDAQGNRATYLGNSKWENK